MNEYVIWGYPPNSDEHTLLVGGYSDGSKITERSEAERIKSWCENEMGATNCKIQHLDGTPPDFTRVFN